MLRLSLLTGAILMAFAPTPAASADDPLTIAASQTGDFAKWPWHLSVNSAGKAELTVETSPLPTRREFQVSKEQLAKLRKALSEEHFFDLADQYGERGTDRRVQALTITVGSRSRTIQLFHLAHWVDGGDQAYLREAARALRVWVVIRAWFADPDAADSSASDRKVLEAAKQTGR
jgi:hypothetical protein